MCAGIRVYIVLNRSKRAGNVYTYCGTFALEQSDASIERGIR